MDFELSKELQMLQKEIRKFAKKEIVPFADQWDEAHYLPIKEVMHPLGEMGYFGTVIPEEYGGEDLG
ncbi:MAG: acyl-CoA dehydrogenase family protein, partial [Desulfobacter sp.]|nr:acyl-CoA dehydrogenase family protein [Desulfobacter sp.]